MHKYPDDCIGRHSSRLTTGDTVYAPMSSAAPALIEGAVTVRDGKPYVHWSDEPTPRPTPLRGMTHSKRRPGEVLDWEKTSTNAV